ncbi:MAG TPA: aminotransferase class III-fold pyridoxal phosphate-dependent enzyme [Gemmatimonadales bacterium]|jgi:acetylornithine/succinyldiaminopimelate/putrescine aminotransferase|nr:aminotransferase class III-fold pyridoxal phosphate-dependent enzyme [Gemmatimonadales bacterium]
MLTEPTTERPALLPVYATFPLRAVAGHGSWLVDEDGHEWLDAYGGHAVASSGHSHPDVVRAISEQAAKLIFYSTAVPHAGREELAEKLASLAPDPLGQVFFCNSGAEANENQIGLARRKTGRTTIVSMRGGWHGRTAATLACTDGARYEAGARRAGVPLSRKVPFNDIAALTAAVDDSVAAVLLEPVQGFAGARTATVEFLQAARALCDQWGAKLLFDEVQCGTGRLGTFTAAETFGVVPDAIAMAKGLAAGLPIGAVLAVPSLVDDIAVGDLGSTFGGGPVPCAAALANIAVIEREDLLANVNRVSAMIAAQAARLPHVVQVHGKGFLLGLELDMPAAEVQKALWQHRVLTGTATDPRTLRLLPPLSFATEEAALLLKSLTAVLA